MVRPLITMTHVCRSWRDVLLSTPSLWTRIDFAASGSRQAEVFLDRSGQQLLDLRHVFKGEEGKEPFLSTVLSNTYRLRRLEIGSSLLHLEPLLEQFSRPAPKLEHLKIKRDNPLEERDMKLHATIFGGQLPKLTDLSLCGFRMELRDFNFSSLTRFALSTETHHPVQDLTSFFERCPLLEFIQLRLPYMYPFRSPTPPPRNRTLLAALKELRFCETACASGLLDHLILPSCTEMKLNGGFAGEESDTNGTPSARIHPSSIDHLPVMTGIAKAVAIPSSCILSGPNGTIRFYCPDLTRDRFNAEFFTSFSPIFVMEIKELWVGEYHTSYEGTSYRPWAPTATDVHSALAALTRVEDLIIVNGRTGPFFSTLGSTTENSLLLPELRRLTIYVGYWGMDVSALLQCVRARKEYSQPLGKVIIVFPKEPGDDVVKGVESVREFTRELIWRVGEDPKLYWAGEGCKRW